MVQILILVAYVAMVIAVTVVTAKKNLSLNHFLLGGREVGAWLSAMSYGASYFSAVIITGYAGSMGWTVGLPAIWCGIGNAVIGSFFAWTFLAKPARMMGERLQVATLPSFFEKRYDSKLIKVLSSMIIFVFLLPYSASVYKGLGNVFSQAFGFDYTYCVIGIALLCSVYLFAGGYKATAITDLIQGFIMLFGMGAVIFYITKAAGGVTEGLAQLGTDVIGGETMNTLWTTPDNTVTLVCNVLLTSLGALGMPQMIHKFFAIKDTKSIKRARVISTSFALFIAGGAYFAGSFGRVVLSKITAPDGVSTMADLVNSGEMAMDQIVPTMLVDQQVVNMPSAIIGLFVVLLLSASISTLTALVLSSSSVITLDVIAPLFPRLKQETTTMIMRGLCVLFVVLSLVINFGMQDTPIVSLMSLSWGTVAGAFLAPFIYGLLSKKVTKTGAIAGVISGALISLLPPLVTGNMALAPVSGTVAMICGLIIVPVVSKLTKESQYTAQHLEKVFGA